ncbi:uncharacterized protein LOC121430814 [Lytechinus variegatus]|uniref:uncharacterized protein LOC121430814 n=1 Tax=Lytechinus variegatus TaxID=7654 RepID=UPI001BB0F663|nr:uncharacterized protein LOC121430814 [Lytechinus variegatus]
MFKMVSYLFLLFGFSFSSLGQSVAESSEGTALSCEPLEVPVNGAIDGYIFNEGTTIKFICFPGHELNGSEALTCERASETNTTSWSDEEPLCQPSIRETLWFRIVIDLAAVVVALMIIILVFLIARYIRRRRRGIFHHWKPPTVRSSIRTSHTLRNEGHHVRFQVQSSPPAISQGENGSGIPSGEDADVEEVTGVVSQVAHLAVESNGTLQAPGTSVDAGGTNSVDTVTVDQEVLPSMTVCAVSEIQKVRKGSLDESVPAVSTPHRLEEFNPAVSSPNHDSNITPDPTCPMERSGFSSKMDKEEAESSETEDRVTSNAVIGQTPQSAESAGSDSGANITEPIVIKPAVRPRNSIIYNPFASGSAAKHKKDDAQSIKGSLLRKKTTKDFISAPMQQAQPSNPKKTFKRVEGNNQERNDHSSFKNNARFSQYDVSASVKPKAAKRGLVTRSCIQTDLNGQAFLGGTGFEPIYATPELVQPEVISKPSAPSPDDLEKGYCSLRVGLQDEYSDSRLGPSENLHYGEENNVDVGRDEQGYCSLRVGPQDEYCDLRLGPSENLHDGEENNADEGRNATRTRITSEKEVQEQDDDYAELRVGESESPLDRCKGTPANTECSERSSMEVVTQNQRSDIYEMVEIGGT